MAEQKWVQIKKEEFDEMLRVAIDVQNPRVRFKRHDYEEMEQEALRNCLNDGDKLVKLLRTYKVPEGM